MNITINGKPHEFAEGATLADALEQFGAPDRGVAVAVDGTVVSRGSWRATPLESGSVIEVLTAVQGG
ncbi:sulfur carrier protein [Halopolyspora algeriensis]|uniref:Sulfur carrier protein n=1 Tax=Halopolyspora algeriensis TaxID=1500506 RepID=A0A368VVV1_9ACTN|nr:sulfur carrier protein ThiS [Halopolyspora algeriensis]RCW43553.1 sulfur carrier protein [Halopolyspora algeriensis]TQM46422.1 sulfur carrier protein [Halopolyspora algeriensis]TQM47662.1 sulfur carrier protein [Halopolyspora algeriensis]